jgi:hypothetical protein
VAARILGGHDAAGMVEAMEEYLLAVGPEPDPTGRQVTELVAEAERRTEITRAEVLAAEAGPPAAAQDGEVASVAVSQGRRMGSTLVACIAWVWSRPSSTRTSQPYLSSSVRRSSSGAARRTRTPPQRSP